MWSLVKLSDSSVLKRVNDGAEFFGDPPDIEHKGMRWYRVVTQDQPAYDSRSQRITKTEGVVGSEYVVGWEVSDLPLVEAKALLTADINAQAQSRIIALTGSTDIISALIKQSNAQMRASELQEIRIQGGTLDAAQEAERVALQGLADAVKAIRAASNVTNAAIGAAETVDAARAAHAAVAWP